MQVIDCTNYKIVIFDAPVGAESLQQTEELYKDCERIYVFLHGANTKYVPHDCSLVKNINASFLNHMMWEGLLDDDEQVEYIKKCAEKFYASGKQMVIEDYDFQEDEPFYDYST